MADELSNEPELDLEAQQQQVETVEPTNARDDVNDAVRDAIASLTPKELTDQTDEPLQRERDAQGKFVAKDKTAEAAPAKAAPVDPKSPPADNQTKVSAEQPSTAASAPPVSWAAEAKSGWSSLPPAIQNAVLKREAEVSAGFRQKSEDVRNYERIISPIAQEAQRNGLSPEEGIQRLVAGHQFLERQPEQAILWLAQKNGIDLAELASNPPAAQRQVRADAAPSQVIPQITSLEQRLQSIEFGNNLSLTQQFAASKPHWADVEDSLPGVIQEIKAAFPGIAPLDLLEKAYDRAVWLNPDVRSKVIAAEQAEQVNARTAKIADKSAQASRAAVSVRGSSMAAKPPPKVAMNGETVHDDVRAAIQQLRAGG